jgi:hypothetical protein
MTEYYRTLEKRETDSVAQKCRRFLRARCQTVRAELPGGTGSRHLLNARETGTTYFAKPGDRWIDLSEW